MTKDVIKTASVLAFERKLANSDALMHAGMWADRENSDQWLPIKVQSKDVRGTISNRLPAALENDPAKLNTKVQNPNLQRVDAAALPFASDTLKIEFSLRVHGNLDQPSACNDHHYQEALSSVVQEYQKDQDFEELAIRYATNIANARFLWRNRVGVDLLEVRVTQLENNEAISSWTFNAPHYSLRSFSHRTPDLNELAKAIQLGLRGSSSTFFIVKAFAHIGQGQEVFPSEELVLDDKKKGGKRLYQVDGTAAMHSQKIGNALRTIDTWYPEANELGPIAVEPYGSVTNRGRAYRQPKMKIDFYTLLDRWVCKQQKPELDQQHYVMATLIRGGVFGEKGD